MFRDRLVGGETLVGSWLKSPSPAVMEVLAESALDVICLDAEHAPFGRTELDVCIHAARAAGMPTLVRVAAFEPHYVLQALDSGATGVLVPHVRSAEEAAALVRSAHFVPGGRGYAGTTRAGGFGTKPMPEHRADSRAETVVIAQIEDVEALAVIDDIVAVAGLDAVFIGPMDLSVSMGAAGPTDLDVLAAIKMVTERSVAAGTPVGIFANTKEQLNVYAEFGITLFLMQSDHAFIQAGADNLATFRPKSR